MSKSENPENSQDTRGNALARGTQVVASRREPSRGTLVKTMPVVCLSNPEACRWAARGRRERYLLSQLKAALFHGRGLGDCFDDSPSRHRESALARAWHRQRRFSCSCYLGSQWCSCRASLHGMPSRPVPSFAFGTASDVFTAGPPHLFASMVRPFPAFSLYLSLSDYILRPALRPISEQCPIYLRRPRERIMVIQLPRGFSELLPSRS
ncbi:hypothetical protein C8F04DRAFT_1159737 [Mycena alexandri]|uniref:Uncharacterized protein n=1 Tax=Mycena alexandri TaxID=1745969 RepID=A0AAD6WLE6_9AGAR|nr:hypothetical protein C8F04DRAFT_1159737 [Mycena alexandri]